MVKAWLCVLKRISSPRFATYIQHSSPPAGLALAIPDLGDLISLIGAFASSALALIFPPVLEILVFGKVPNHKLLGLPRPVWFTKDILILMLGIVGFLFGTYASLVEIGKNIAKGNTEPEYCGFGSCAYNYTD